SVLVAVYCTSPPHIDNARHNALPEQTTFDLDSTLHYQCYLGYVTSGFPKAKCLAIDGAASWFGPDITCEPRSCGLPDDIPNGWHAGECHTYGCRVTYHCADGFELTGRGERFCQADGTWSPKELPACVQINCGHPGPLYNGWIENIESGTGLGASIIFRCHDGMKLEGNTSSVCQIDGRWRYPLPKCLAPCVVPGVKQGSVHLLSAAAGDKEAAREPIKELPMVVPHGEKLAVECQPHYEFPGNHTPVVCNNGTWTHIPRCEPARCKRMPRAPRNGMVIAPKTEHGMRARFKCKDGYTLRGPNVTECSYGNWTADMPYCQEVYCPFPGYIENGRVMLVGNMGVYDYRPYVRKVTNNKQIMYECERGYACAGAGAEAEAEAALVRRKRGGMRVSSGASTSSRTHMMRGKSNNNNDGSRGSRGRKPKRPTDERVRPGHRPRPKTGKGTPCELLADEPTMRVEVVKAGRDPNQTYSPGTVVRVSCSKGYSLSLGRHSNNTAKCARGQWKPAKPECLIQNDDYPEGMVRTNGTCLYRNSEPNLVSFYNDQQITEEVVEFPPGSLVVSRCVDIGKYAMIGSNRRRCVAGEWDGQKPVCFGLNQENDYALEKPPTILFRHQLGPIAQSNDGRLVVYPGTILHMECLWIRRFGTPKKYPEGWTTDPGRDSQLEYRLSIYHAGRDDSGTFTCVTPTRHTHAVEIIVKGIECADLMNLTDPHLRVSILSREVGGRAVFSCAQGYGLRGPHEAICLHTGDWASPLPTCEEVQCNSPGVPENGYIQGNGPYKAGDVIQFNCNPDYMMEGQPIIACQENGVQACSYPGTTISGRMSAVKFYYKIGETITFTCDEGLDLRGAPMLRCLRNGKWSNAIPTCVSSNR
ncbi:Locomotion-related protein Hikaru genki, partial [Gryllus bimaculatus]